MRRGRRPTRCATRIAARRSIASLMVMIVWRTISIASPPAIATRMTRQARSAPSTRFVIDGKILRRLRPPDVERILARMITGSPVHVRRDVIDIAGIFAPAVPRIANVMEVVGAQDVAPQSPARPITLSRHLHRAKPDRLHGTGIPGEMMQPRRLGLQEREHVMVAAVDRMHEAQHLAAAIGNL